MGERGNTMRSGHALAALVRAAAFSACNGASEVSATPAATAPETTTSAATTAATTVSTTATSTTSTTVESIVLPLAQPHDPDLKVLFSLPVGLDGVTFEGGFQHWMLSGRQAVTVPLDGSVWIADTNGRRLLQMAADGSRLATIDTNEDDVGGLIDVAAVQDGVWGFEVVPALSRHRIVLSDA